MYARLMEPFTLYEYELFAIFCLATTGCPVVRKGNRMVYRDDLDIVSDAQSLFRLQSAHHGILVFWRQRLPQADVVRG